MNYLWVCLVLLLSRVISPLSCLACFITHTPSSCGFLWLASIQRKESNRCTVFLFLVTTLFFFFAWLLRCSLTASFPHAGYDNVAIPLTGALRASDQDWYSFSMPPVPVSCCRLIFFPPLWSPSNKRWHLNIENLLQTLSPGSHELLGNRIGDSN